MSLHFATNLGRHLRLAIGAILLASVPLSSVNAGDWPQILGPQRNAVAAADERLADSWPAAGPPVLWQREVGSGYAGVALAGNRLVLLHREKNEAVCEALDAATGKPQWRVAFPTKYVSTIAPDDGPRCVPLIHKEHVYLYGADADLHCVKLADGKPVWSRLLAKVFDIPDSYFGAGSTPIVVDGKLLVNVGGRNGAGIVAFDLANGKAAWQATDEGASYSAPTSGIVDGQLTAIFAARLNAVGINPADGKVLFSIPFGQRGPTVNAATPLVVNDRLFLSASYGIGAVWARISKTGAEELWASDEVMSSQYTTCAAADGYFYGIDGRQDGGEARLRCFDPATKRIAWTADNFGTGNLILADGKLLILKTDGTLTLVRATPMKFEQLAASKLFDTTAQALPALANGCLFVRDTRTLKCVDVSRKIK